ncbi:MAG: FAD:protein FMN transferase [Desulfomonilaceae bacterium]
MTFPLYRPLVVAAAALLISSCADKEPATLYKSSRFLMGTFVQITIPGEAETAKAAAEAIFSELKRVEDLTSFHKPSGLTKINDQSGNGPIKADHELLALIGESLRFAKQTQGAFDPTVGPLTRLWNFSAGDPRLPSSSEITSALAKIGWRRVAIDPTVGTITLPDRGMALDLGGIAKGYALDRAAAVIRKRRISAALVNAGGDVLVVGEREPGRPWRIGVQDPRNERAMVAVAKLKDCVVQTSGDYERCFIEGGKRYHHILNPATGYPADGLQSVTVVSPTGMTVVTAGIFVLGVEEGLKYIESVPDAQGFLIDFEGRIHKSAGADSIFDFKQK